MSQTAIVVESLSKRYLIGHQLSGIRFRDRTLRDLIGREARNFARKAAEVFRGNQVVQGDEIEEFWALQDVSFELKQGEVLGIIGRNGAGKSTLLKILSRITEPTSGRIVLHGRVSSLLEVGTGFHPELTGRENIFLNGAILGMRQREIRKKFDEIVAFAEVEKFLDTPVKYFSSGMYVRLAFAVAAHLEPEILIVDEVLAVGDANFQTKCLGKLGEVSRKDGRTVLFVSHDLASINELTHQAVLIQGGRVIRHGPTHDIISTYLSQLKTEYSYVRPAHLRTVEPHISRVELTTSDANGIHQFSKPLTVRIWISHKVAMSQGYLALKIVNQFQHSTVYAWAYYPEVKFGMEPGETCLTCTFPSLKLNVGRYYLRIYLDGSPNNMQYEKLDGICSFEVVRTDQAKPWGWDPESCTYHEQWHWRIEELSQAEKL